MREFDMLRFWYEKVATTAYVFRYTALMEETIPLFWHWEDITFSVSPNLRFSNADASHLEL